MRIKKTFSLLLALCLISVATTFLLTACGDPNSNKNPDEQNIPTSITLSETTVNMLIGETYQLYATVSPLDDNAKVTWTSLNKEIITVDNNGKVTALSKGTSVIRAVTENNLVASCTINVSQAIGNIEVNVTYKAKANSSILADKNAEIYVIPENLESFPSDFQLATYYDYTSYGILAGNTDTMGKKTFYDIPAGTYKVIIMSANIRNPLVIMTDLMELTESGETYIKSRFGDNLYQKLQVLKDFMMSDNLTYYDDLGYKLAFYNAISETVEITNGATQSISYNFTEFLDFI